MSGSHFFLAGSFFIQPQEWSKTLPANPRGYFPPLIPNLFVFLPVLRWREEGQIEMVFMWSSLSPSWFFLILSLQMKKVGWFLRNKKKEWPCPLQQLLFVALPRKEMLSGKEGFILGSPIYEDQILQD